MATGHLDGRPVIVSGGSDKAIRIWDTATGKPVGDPLTGHTGRVTAVAIGQLDGRPIIVSGSSDKTLKVWDAASGKPLGDPLTGHDGWVTAVAMGQLDGRPIVISGSSVDKTVRIWTLGPFADGEPGGSEKAQALPTRIDLAAHVLGVTFSGPAQFAAVSDLGIVSLQIRRPR